MADLALHRIETGEASPTEARAAIAEMLKDGSVKSLGLLYGALGAWLWRAIDGRRRDEELRDWFDIFRRTSAALAEKEPAYAERLRAFYDLLQTSITTSEVVSVREVMQREHVRDVIRILAADARPIEKSAIERRLGLKPSNLTRILNMMADARLVERTSHGRHAQFCLTRSGIAASSELAKQTPDATKKKIPQPAPQRHPLPDSLLRSGLLARAAFENALTRHMMDRRGEPHAQTLGVRTINLSDLADLLLSGGGPTFTGAEHSVLQQVNVTTVPGNRSYETSMKAGMVKWIVKKKAESSHVRVPRIVVETPVETSKDFKAMISYLEKERDHVER